MLLPTYPGKKAVPSEPISPTITDELFCHTVMGADCPEAAWITMPVAVGLHRRLITVAILIIPFMVSEPNVGPLVIAIGCGRENVIELPEGPRLPGSPFLR